MTWINIEICISSHSFDFFMSELAFLHFDFWLKRWLFGWFLQEMVACLRQRMTRGYSWSNSWWRTFKNTYSLQTINLKISSSKQSFREESSLSIINDENPNLPMACWFYWTFWGLNQLNPRPKKTLKNSLLTKRPWMTMNDWNTEFDEFWWTLMIRHKPANKK